MRPVLLPETIDGLWDIMDTYPDAMIYSGGTDLLLMMRKGIFNPPSLICLERLETLKCVSENDLEIAIGAVTTHTQLLNNNKICTHYPVLVKALKVLGSPHIRNMGTIGGNIMTASPAGDTLPALYVLGAEVELWSKKEKRKMLIDEFITGPGRTLIKPGEILGRILIPKSPLYNIHHYEKVGLRKAMACSVATFAAVLNLNENKRVDSIRMAWGSVGPCIKTIPEAESMLTSRQLTTEHLKKMADIVRKIVLPISDIRASETYRKQLAGNLVKRLIIYNYDEYKEAHGK